MGNKILKKYHHSIYYFLGNINLRYKKLFNKYQKYI